MGKSTLVTRRGVRHHTLATGERDIGREYFGCPAAMRRRAPYRRARCHVSGQKPFGLDSLQVSVTRGAMFCPFWWVTFPEHTWSLFAGCRMGSGRCLSRSRHCPHPPMMISRLAEPQQGVLWNGNRRSLKAKTCRQNSLPKSLAPPFSVSRNRNATSMPTLPSSGRYCPVTPLNPQSSRNRQNTSGGR